MSKGMEERDCVGVNGLKRVGNPSSRLTSSQADKDFSRVRVSRLARVRSFDRSIVRFDYRRYRETDVASAPFQRDATCQHPMYAYVPSNQILTLNAAFPQFIKQLKIRERERKTKSVWKYYGGSQVLKC